MNHSSLRGLVRGKSVAIVGKAPTLVGSRLGRHIDACQVVVRVNWLLPLKGDRRDIGSRTDVLYCHRSARKQRKSAKRINLRLPDLNVRQSLIGESPDYVPTTGLVAIFDALKQGARQVKAFGFNLYAPNSNRGTSWESNSTGFPHDIEKDRLMLARLVATEPRFMPDAALLVTLKG